MEKQSKFQNLVSRFFLFIIISLTFHSFFSSNVKAQATSQNTLEGEITGIYSESEISFEQDGDKQLYQELEVRLTSGKKKGEKITVKNGNYPMMNVIKYKVGDKVVLSKLSYPDTPDEYLITDYVRRMPMFVLALIFASLTVLIGRLRGVFSIVGLVVSFAIIFAFILPRIFAGDDPVVVVILGSTIIIPVTFYLSHGFNNKTTVAIIGTLMSLIATGLLASLFTEITNLTGYTTDEASFIQSISQDRVFDVKNLLLAGIIIGVLGVLDDVTVSQASIVEQLKAVNDKLKDSELFARAMSVGRDHITSMVNTLVLVYTGASLPLLILFLDSSKSIWEIINYEIVAEEIVRTLVGSIGLIMAVPITTFIAVVFIGQGLGGGKKQ